MVRKYLLLPILPAGRQVFFIVVIELLLFLVNYVPGTRLIGWDGLYPQLNFPLNVSREIFGVWQEARGLGMWDGMSHASNLLHTLFLWMISIAIPQDLLRYSFIFLMHAVGVIGMYILLKELFRSQINPLLSTLYALIGSLFYGLNIGVMQLFYAPLEVFAIHFAFLPLLTWSLVRFLSSPSKKAIFVFALFSLCATPQGYVPQIFLSYLLLISSILAIFMFYRHWTSGAIKQCIVVCATIFCTNAFWLLPYVGGLPQNTPIIINSKINQMASTRIYLMNQYRGDLLDVLFLKGFMLDMTDVGNNGNTTYIMPEWRTYTSSIFFILPSLLFAALTVFGIIRTIRVQKRMLYPFVITFGITFFFLGNNIPLLNLLNALLRWLLPAFNEAFRFPFTKFETLFAFSYTIFLVYGSIELPKFVEELVSIEHEGNIFFQFRSTLTKHTTYYILLNTCLLFLYSLPSFTGHFLYSNVRVTIEPEYQQVLSYFNSVDPNARIAPLPQPTFYNWEYHANGYRGSGFLWYGLPQSMMERSFDPWSNYNEGYYWELSQAVYMQNADLLKSVLNKYQIEYVMLDGNRVYPFSPSSLLIPETKQLLTKAGLREMKTFGKITMYENSGQSTVFSTQNLPSINSYTFGSIDQAYLQHGTYQSPTSTSEAPLFYPFRSLFTSRSPSEKDFSLQNEQNTIVFSNTLPGNISHVLIPSFTTLEKLIPATIYLKRNRQGIYTIYSIVSTPTISVGKQIIWRESFTYPLFTLPKHPAFPLTISVNGQKVTTLKSLTDSSLGTTLLSTIEDNSISITDARGGGLNTTTSSSNIREHLGKPASIMFTSTGPLTFSVTVPKVTDNIYGYFPNIKNAPITNCNTLQDGTISSENHAGLTLSSELADACTSFVNNNANTSLGYIVLINHSHSAGQPLGFWVEDTTDQYAFSQVDLPNTSQSSTDSLILPPMQEENVGYSFHFDNPATSTNLTQNTLSSLSVYPIPFTFLQNLETDSQQPLPTSSSTPAIFDHPNSSLYSTTFTLLDNQTIILSQAYDPGWHSYLIPNTKYLPAGRQGQILNTLEEAFPFLFGQELKDHVKVNNWENGWNILGNSQQALGSRQQIVIVFLPQYLEYLGFLLLAGYFLYLILNKIA